MELPILCNGLRHETVIFQDGVGNLGALIGKRDDDARAQC